ncbi:MAG: hypothetical protein Q7R33_08790, partial [Nitrosarchaeum sp.]|nr:hypothetical protein [Nitrosarchaeum sp.]
MTYISKLQKFQYVSMLSVVLVLPFLLTIAFAQLETDESKENTDKLIEAASYMEETKYNLALHA